MAALPQTIFKKATQVTAKTAQATARAIAQQSHETLKDVKDQVGLPQAETSPQTESNEAPPQVVQNIQTQGVDSIDREAIARQERAMLADLEAQLARLRAKRQQEVSSYAQNQQALMDAQKTSAPAEVAEPQGKVRKALGKAKKAITNLISNRKQGETKQGSGKG